MLSFDELPHSVTAAVGRKLSARSVADLGAGAKTLRSVLGDQLMPDALRVRSQNERRAIIEPFIQQLDENGDRYGTDPWKTVELLAERLTTIGELQQALLDAEKRIDRKLQNLTTALLESAAHGRPELTRSLVRLSARQSESLQFDQAAFRSAAAHGRLGIFKALLDAGTGLDGRDRRGNTALIIAAKNGHAEAVRMLLSAGAKPNATNAAGISAETAALQAGHHDVVAVLHAFALSLGTSAAEFQTAAGALRAQDRWNRELFDPAGP